MNYTDPLKPFVLISASRAAWSAEERTPQGKIDAAIAEFERAREAYYAAKANQQNPEHVTMWTDANGRARHTNTVQS